MHDYANLQVDGIAKGLLCVCACVALGPGRSGFYYSSYEDICHECTHRNTQMHTKVVISRQCAIFHERLIAYLCVLSLGKILRDTLLQSF